MWYKPLSYMAKKCNSCRILYVNEDVYHTYTSDVNKNLGDSLLCLVGINVKQRTIAKEKGELKKFKQKEVKNENKEQKNQLKEQEKNTRNTLGNDPRFKDLFSSFRN